MPRSLMNRVQNVTSNVAQGMNAINTIRRIFRSPGNEWGKIQAGLDRKDLLTERSISAQTFEPFRQNKFLVVFPDFHYNYFTDINYLGSTPGLPGAMHGVVSIPIEYYTLDDPTAPVGLTNYDNYSMNPERFHNIPNPQGNASVVASLARNAMSLAGQQNSLLGRAASSNGSSNNPTGPDSIRNRTQFIGTDTQNASMIGEQLNTNHDGLVSFVKSVKLAAVGQYSKITDTINGHKHTYLCKRNPVTQFQINYTDSNDLAVFQMIEAWQQYEMFAKKYQQRCFIYKFKNNWMLEPYMYEARNIVPELSQTDLDLSYGNEGKTHRFSFVVNFSCSDIIRKNFDPNDGGQSVFGRVIEAATTIGLGVSPDMLKYFVETATEPVHLPIMANMITKIAAAKNGQITGTGRSR